MKSAEQGPIPPSMMGMEWASGVWEKAETDMSNKRSIIRFGMFIAYDKSIHHRGHRVPQGETMDFIGFRDTYY